MATELISLGVLFFCAIVGGIIAARFRQPAVFGLLLVGAIIGPHSLNLVQDIGMINVMAEFGAILILFIIGLEFDISKLIKLGARSILIGFLKFAIVLFFGYQTTLLLGFSTKVALFVGVILSFSSTVVVIKVLEQKELFSRKEVPLLIAILIIEDILAVFTLTFFSGVKDASSGILPLFEHIIFSIAILVFAYYLMMKILRKGVNLILTNNSDESVFAFLSLGIGALFSYFASYLGLAPSAGAFLAGSLIASLPNSKEYGRAIHPYSLIFTSIFFISMGTLVDFRVISDYMFLIIALLFTVLVSRFIAVGIMTYLLANFKDEQPFFSSIAMISVGEFSLLVAKESEKFNLGIDLVTISAAIIFISAIIMSVLINYSGSLHTKISSKVSTASKIKMEKISNYMRTFFDQMEIENHFTKKLRYDSKIMFLLAIAAVFTFFILRKVVVLIQQNTQGIYVYAFYGASSMLLLYVLALFYRQVKSIQSTMSVILTHVDSSQNIKKCEKILNNFSIALFLLFAGLLFPFAIFLFNLNVWTNLIPFALIAISGYFIRGLVALIDGHSSSVTHFGTSVAIAKLFKF